MSALSRKSVRAIPKVSALSRKMSALSRKSVRAIPKNVRAIPKNVRAIPKMSLSQKGDVRAIPKKCPRCPDQKGAFWVD